MPYWRLYWNNRSGAWLLATDGTRHAITPDHFTLVAPNTVLSQELTRPVDHFYVHFITGMPIARFQNQVYKIPALAPLLNAIHKAFPRRGAPAPPYLLSVATAMQACWYALTILPATQLSANERDLRINKLLQWWESKDWQPVGNNELATQFRMNPSAFSRCFHQAMGISPQTFGMIKRIERACLLLHYSDLSIKQIASAMGFCDRYHFSYTFHKLRGVSPAAFRRQQH